MCKIYPLAHFCAAFSNVFEENELIIQLPSYFIITFDFTQVYVFINQKNLVVSIEVG